MPRAHALPVELTAQEHFTGTQVSYYLICKTKLWLFAHHITMESGSDLVAMGALHPRDFLCPGEKRPHHR